MYQIFQKLQNTQTALKESIDNKLTPRSRKIIKYSILVFFIIAFLPEIYIVPYYFLIVKPSAETEINHILGEVQTINDTGKKVDTLSEWEQRNFTNIYGFTPNASLDFGAYFLFRDGRYPVYINTSDPQPIKIRAFISPFTNDLYWITYYHSGACSELAHLFDFVLNQSGIESRLVVTKGEDHNWNEINIAGKWYYFDPTLVEIYQKNPEYRNKWFSEPKDFERAWGWNVSRVTVESTSEDITENYTSVVHVTAYLNSTKHIVVSKFDSGKQKWFTLFSKDVTYSNNFTSEQIQLGESNRYKIHASNYGDIIPIPMYQEQEFFLNTTENVSLNLNPDNGQYDLVPGFSVLGICLIVIWYEIKWIRQWIQKRKDDGILKKPK